MSILATKLYIPPPRPNVVRRSRLIARLNAGLHRKLIVISAPAGFGKTTLVSTWIADSKQQVTWLSLDEGDRDLSRFLTHLVAALQTVAPNFGTEVLALLQSAQPRREAVGIDALLTPLLNEVATLPHQLVLVLDDYHVLDTGDPLGAVDQALTFLLEHLPPQLHLLITTREDPQLPLARLRAQGQLTEVRAADLRFTAAEAAEFLNQVMDLDLSPADIATLEARTEGWIAGLQLAALSLQDHQDVAGFIRAFAGDHHYIVDYLVEEVLQRQPAPIRSFLLQTAILDRLHGELCDAVTGQPGGNARLEALRRGNFFVVPLDDKRQWYRYHQLFADVLASHLRAEQPEQVAILHQRASAWYAAHALPAAAIRHALAAKDFVRAAELIELAESAMLRERQEATLLGWLKALPEELFQTRPVLNVVYAGTLLSNGESDGIEERLQDAERWLDMTANARERQDAVATGMVVVDSAEFRRLPGSIAMYRAGKALAVGNIPTTMMYAQRVLDLTAEDDHRQRGAATALLGLAAWTIGDLEVAYQSYAEGMAQLQRAGNISDAIGGVLALADIRITQGQLRDARRIYERALQVARENGTPTLRGTADMYVGISELEREHNDLHGATQLLLRSQAQGEHTGFPRNPYRWRVAMARIKEAAGDLDGAIALLQEAERLYVSDFYPNVRPVAALKTRVWLAQGRLGEAHNWAREQGLSAQDELSYLREFDYITLARMYLAQYQRDQAAAALSAATSLLARLLQAAEAGGRMGSVIEILGLQALARQMQGNSAAALLLLERALTLAEPEGYVRIFVDEGLPMAQLLRAVAASKGQPAIMPAYISKLLAAFGVAQPPNTVPAPLPPTPAPQPLIEPLSQRELEVLRLFQTELSGPEIAQQLVVGLSTVRTHTKRIYSKLNVNNRRAAVTRAIALDLL